MIICSYISIDVPSGLLGAVVDEVGDITFVLTIKTSFSPSLPEDSKLNISSEASKLSNCCLSSPIGP